MVVEALAWTPGTNGTVKAKAFNLVTPEGPLADPDADPNAAGRGGRGPARLGPTEASSTAYLDSVKDKVRGAAVLVGKPVFVPVNLDAAARPSDRLRCTAAIDRRAPHRRRRAPAVTGRGATAAAAGGAAAAGRLG